MKRSKFLASLFGAAGVARAQVALSGIDGDSKAGLQQIRAWEKYRPKNNQCPVCGTMAKPFVMGDSKVLPTESITIAGLKFPVNLTRCARCNAAFWQEAEK